MSENQKIALKWWDKLSYEDKKLYIRRCNLFIRNYTRLAKIEFMYNRMTVLLQTKDGILS